jgi:hypothetical protein
MEVIENHRQVMSSLDNTLSEHESEFRSELSKL